MLTSEFRSTWTWRHTSHIWWEGWHRAQISLILNKFSRISHLPYQIRISLITSIKYGQLCRRHCLHKATILVLSSRGFEGSCDPPVVPRGFQEALTLSTFDGLLVYLKCTCLVWAESFVSRYGWKCWMSVTRLLQVQGMSLTWWSPIDGIS